MIDIQDKKDCCGCSACAQRCPKHCITMIEDREGFLYPSIDLVQCIDCGLCEKVCPEINQNERRLPIDVYAAKNLDETIRMNSSSGGIFTILAEKVIDEGGVVFGVGFNKHWEAAHSYTETKEGLKNFRMSKYVQSIVGNTFSEAESFLKKGRKVLYSGTPCQIAGLKRYLRKEYDNLFTIDFICHGTPSPGVFRWYLAEECIRIVSKKDKFSKFSSQSIPSIPKVDVIANTCGLEINDIRFRDKKEGWKKFSFTLNLSKKTTTGEKEKVLISSTLDTNTFLRGFLSDFYLRPSCHDCPAKCLKGGSDITIGDFWGIQDLKPEFDDDKGVSVLLINSNKALETVQKLSIQKLRMDYNSVSTYNSALELSVCLKPSRNHFYKSTTIGFDNTIKKLTHVGCLRKMKNLIVRILRKLYSLLKRH